MIDVHFVHLRKLSTVELVELFSALGKVLAKTDTGSRTRAFIMSMLHYPMFLKLVDAAHFNYRRCRYGMAALQQVSTEIRRV